MLFLFHSLFYSFLLFHYYPIHSHFFLLKSILQILFFLVEYWGGKHLFEREKFCIPAPLFSFSRAYFLKHLFFLSCCLCIYNIDLENLVIYFLKLNYLLFRRLVNDAHPRFLFSWIHFLFLPGLIRYNFSKNYFLTRKT